MLRDEPFGRCRTVDLSTHTATLCLQRVRGHRHRPIERRRQIVRQHLGGHINQQGMLTQPSHTLQHQPAPTRLIAALETADRMHRFKGRRLVCNDGTLLAPAQRACLRSRSLAGPDQRARGLHLPGNDLMLTHKAMRQT